MATTPEINDSAETLLKKILEVLNSGGGGGGSVDWSAILNKPSSFPPDLHKETHYTGGTDPLTPADIGAATAAQGALADTALQPGEALANPVDSIEFDTTAGVDVDTPGEFAWDSEEETLELGLQDGTVIRVGQELHFHVKNQTVSNIAKGVLVQYAGTDGNSGKILIEPWDGTLPAKTILGFTTHEIVADDTGYVTAFGKLRGIQTNGTNYSETWQNEDIIWADPNGGLTNVMPEAPATKTSVAVVINAAGSNGVLFVRPTIGPNLSEDQLVELSTPVEGDTLIWRTNRFVNEPAATGGGGADLQEVWMNSGI